MNGIFVGTIQKVYAPGDQNNSNGYQYEYSCLVTVDNFATIPCNHCIRSDDDGFGDDYEDKILKPGASVLILFPQIGHGVGIIMGAVRNYAKAMDPSLGNYWRKRYNQVNMYIDQNNNFSITSDSGPNLQINTSNIVIDDSAGDNITLDKANKIMTINANKWQVNVVGDANVAVGGNLNATVQGNANLTAQGDVVAQGKTIQLNGKKSGITTANSHQGVIDLITGVPVEPSPTTTGDV